MNEKLKLSLNMETQNLIYTSGTAENTTKGISTGTNRNKTLNNLKNIHIVDGRIEYKILVDQNNDCFYTLFLGYLTKDQEYTKEVYEKQYGTIVQYYEDVLIKKEDNSLQNSNIKELANTNNYLLNKLAEIVLNITKPFANDRNLIEWDEKDKCYKIAVDPNHLEPFIVSYDDIRFKNNDNQREDKRLFLNRLKDFTNLQFKKYKINGKKDILENQNFLLWNKIDYKQGLIYLYFKPTEIYCKLIERYTPINININEINDISVIKNLTIYIQKNLVIKSNTAKIWANKNFISLRLKEFSDQILNISFYDPYGKINKHTTYYHFKKANKESGELNFIKITNDILKIPYIKNFYFSLSSNGDQLLTADQTVINIEIIEKYEKERVRLDKIKNDLKLKKDTKYDIDELRKEIINIENIIYKLQNENLEEIFKRSSKEILENTFIIIELDENNKKLKELFNSINN